ncbi:hypothetical protein [Plantactinospora veratri]
MSTSADGDGRPDNGPFDGVPDLPADWGRIVIPDDPAELAAEAAQIRRELRLRARRDGWRRRLGLRTTTAGPAPLRLCLLILSVALLATLTSLFAITWPNPQRPVATGRSTPAAARAARRARSPAPCPRWTCWARTDGSSRCAACSPPWSS